MGASEYYATSGWYDTFLRGYVPHPIGDDPIFMDGKLMNAGNIVTGEET